MTKVREKSKQAGLLEQKKRQIDEVVRPYDELLTSGTLTTGDEAGLVNDICQQEGDAASQLIEYLHQHFPDRIDMLHQIFLNHQSAQARNSVLDAFASREDATTIAMLAKEQYTRLGETGGANIGTSLHAINLIGQTIDFNDGPSVYLEAADLINAIPDQPDQEQALEHMRTYDPPHRYTILLEVGQDAQRTEMAQKAIDHLAHEQSALDHDADWCIANIVDARAGIDDYELVNYLGSNYPERIDLLDRIIQQSENISDEAWGKAQVWLNENYQHGMEQSGKASLSNKPTDGLERAQEVMESGWKTKGAAPQPEGRKYIRQRRGLDTSHKPGD